MDQARFELSPLLWLPSDSAEVTLPERTDGYKPSHHKFLDDDMEEAYMYLESRGGLFGETTFFGAQAHCLRYLCGNVIDERQVKIAAKRYKKYYGSDDVFNERGFLDLVNELGGRLPLEVSAIPEGLTVPVRTPLMTFRNTRGKKYRWLPGYLEGLNFKPWYPTTVCTLSNHIIRMLYQFLIETGTPEEIALKLIDFGYRGVSSEESAQIGGSAHAVNSAASDTVSCISHILKYYGMGLEEDYMPIGSIQATEHFVMTHRGKQRENEVVADILRKCPSGSIAIVGDSYNIYEFCEKIIGGVLRDKVRERDGITIVRPDSGDPIPVMMRVLWLLGEQFGFKEQTNGKPYKLLNKVRVLQGDKNDYDAIYDMCRALKGARWSIDNIAFGMGGALLQGLTRDTQKFAMKCSSITVHGKWQDVFKDPITDPGKASKPGRFNVTRSKDGRYSSTPMSQELIYTGNLLRPIFREGEMLVLDNFEVIRERASEWMRQAA